MHNLPEIKVHDKVLLNSGEVAYINRIYRQGISYQALIQTIGGLLVGTVLHRNIVKVYPIQSVEGYAV